MKRTTLKIPDALDARLRHEARRRGITVSQLTREALEAHLGGDGTRPGRRIAAAGMFCSEGEPVAERMEEILRRAAAEGR